MATANNAILTRRNGMQSACEPCRKRKVACDHATPVCRRCTKGRIPEKCKYVVAPMSRLSVFTNQTETIAPSSSTTQRSVPPQKPLPFSNLSSATQSSPSVTSLYDKSRGYLGHTSFSAVFVENRSDLESPIVDPFPHQKGLAPLTPDDSFDTRNQEIIDSEVIQESVRLLKALPDYNVVDRLFSKEYNPNDGWAKLAGPAIVESLYAWLRSRNCGYQNYQLDTLAYRISKNTATVLEERDEGSAWLEPHKDENLRWETVGILFCYLAFSAINCKDDKSLFESNEGQSRDGREIMKGFQKCAGSCIDLCEKLGQANTLLVWLIYKHSLLQSIITGDACKFVTHNRLFILNFNEAVLLRPQSLHEHIGKQRTRFANDIEGPLLWKLHGKMCALATFLGIHSDIGGKGSELTIWIQMKRRMFASIFTIDKVLATFTGRPPMLSSRYSSTPLPLDISDEVLLTGGQTLIRAVAALDPNGWNTEGKLFSTTLVRARNMFARILEEILEIALGPDNTGKKIERAL
jgi:hypothetical protein